MKINLINSYSSWQNSAIDHYETKMSLFPNLTGGTLHFNFNFNFILPKVNTDYIRQAQVLNIDNLRLIINLFCRNIVPNMNTKEIKFFKAKWI